MNNNIEEEEIDLLELFLELVSHWFVLLLALVVFAVAGLGYGLLFVTPQYASTSKLYVLSKSTTITSIADIQVGTNLASDYQEVITGRPVLEQVITNLKLDTDYETLYNKVQVTNATGTRILAITVTDSDVELAKTMTDEIAEVSAAFISEKMDQDPPNIIQYGYTDGKKVNHGPLWYAAVAGMIGFILAAGIIVLRYLLNDNIQVPEDLEKKAHLNVLATLPLEKK